MGNTCPKAGSVVFLSLVLMTAGFVLTLAGWFAPPINDSVKRVRTAGPVSLLIGILLLGISCCVCAFQQKKCCTCCYAKSAKPQEEMEHTQMSPLLLREMRQAMDKCGVGVSAATTTGAGCSTSSVEQQQYCEPQLYQNMHLESPRRNRNRKKRVEHSDATGNNIDAIVFKSINNQFTNKSPRAVSILIASSRLSDQTDLYPASPSPKTQNTSKSAPGSPGSPKTNDLDNADTIPHPFSVTRIIAGSPSSQSAHAHNSQSHNGSTLVSSPSGYKRNYEDMVSAL